MSRMTNGSDVLKDQIRSPSIDEDSSGGSMVAGGGGLKKGPWTSQEDAILVEYVKKHGEGNWNAVQKHSGLSRCGKSCRLRWANHLRPNLKKGAFSQEEEQLIIELHAQMGNKWARMAARLPGRTDNEIKNYWNTRIKRRQRANLPLYPPDICFQGSNENEHSPVANDFSNCDKQHSRFMQGGDYDILDFKIDNFVESQGFLSYTTPFPDISLSSMLSQGFGTQGYGFVNPTVSHTKRLWDSEILFPGLVGDINNGFSSFEQFSDEPPGKIHRTFELGYQYDLEPGSKSTMQLGGAIPGSHALLNGNDSASSPLSGDMKMELPSLQFPETDLSSWLAFPSAPFLEPVHTYIQSPPESESLPSDNVSPRNSGLLDALLQEAQTLNTAKNQLPEMVPNTSEVTANEMVGSSSLKICETDLEEYDPISPLGHPAASVFNECTTPPLSGRALDELFPRKGPAGSNSKLEIGQRVSAPSHEERVNLPRPEFLRPDALLGSGWIQASSQTSRDRDMLNEALGPLLGEDACKRAPSGMSSSFAEGEKFDSCPWNNMPGVCQVSEQP